jgi:hypothetical protein
VTPRRVMPDPSRGAHVPAHDAAILTAATWRSTPKTPWRSIRTNARAAMTCSAPASSTRSTRKNGGRSARFTLAAETDARRSASVRSLNDVSLAKGVRADPLSFSRRAHGSILRTPSGRRREWCHDPADGEGGSRRSTGGNRDSDARPAPAHEADPCAPSWLARAMDRCLGAPSVGERRCEPSSRRGRPKRNLGAVANDHHPELRGALLRNRPLRLGKCPDSTAGRSASRSHLARRRRRGEVP